MGKFKNWAKSRALKAKIHAAALMLTRLSIQEGFSPAQSQAEAAWSDPKFLSWLESKGVKATAGRPPSKYADGGVGRAYFIGDKVVKFTDNRVEANVANMVVGDFKTPTRIFGVYRFKPKPLWAIVQKKIDMNLPKMVAKASDLLMAYVDETGISEFPEDEQSRVKIAKEVASMFEESPELTPFIVDVIKVLDALYRNTGFFHDDAVPQNLGMDSGSVVIPDLGPNQTRDFSARKSLDKIHDRRAKMGLASVEEV